MTYRDMRPEVVHLDVIKVGRALESVVRPVQPAQPTVDSRIAVPNHAEVAFEVRKVNRVKTDL
jgi:hypothetical protein